MNPILHADGSTVTGSNNTGQAQLITLTTALSALHSGGLAGIGLAKVRFAASYSGMVTGGGSVVQATLEWSGPGGMQTAIIGDDGVAPDAFTQPNGHPWDGTSLEANSMSVSVEFNLNPGANATLSVGDLNATAFETGFRVSATEGASVGGTALSGTSVATILMPAAVCAQTEPSADTHSPSEAGSW